MQTMRKKLIVTLLLCYFSAIGAINTALIAQEAYDGYYFPRYHVEVTVHPDNSFSVLEQMDVYFNVSSHGLYRTIPTDVWINRDVSEAQDHSQSERRNYHPKIKDIKVSAECKTFDEDGCMDIRIGSPNQEVIGLQHYDLSYTMVLPDDRVEQADLFFFTMLGTANGCTTNEFTYRVKFEKPLPDGALSKLQVFSGTLGSSNEGIQGEAQFLTGINTLEGKLVNINPYEAVTVYLPLPQGYFETQTPGMVYVSWFLILFATVMLLYVLRRELTVDTKVTPVVTFYPPKDVSSADVGTLIDCQVDDRDLISLIPWFANYGYLRIEKKQGGDGVVLAKQCNLPDGVPNYQERFFTGLFKSGYKFDLNKDSSQNFGYYWLQAKEHLEQSFRGKLNESDTSAFKLLLVALIPVAIALGCASVVSGSAYFGFCMFLSFALEATIMFVSYSERDALGFSWIKSLPFVLIPFIFFSGLLPEPLVDFVREIIYGVIEIDIFGADFSETIRDLYVPQWAYVGLIVLAFVVCLLAMRMTKMSNYRRTHLGEVLGLREFIKTADRDRLKMLLNEDERYFYNVLPFAVAFGMADKWAEKFEGLAMPLETGYDQAMNTRILGDLIRLIDNSHFRHGIVAEQKSRAEAAARAASKSGGSWHSSGSFGGGGHGYSGGGFGGGGSRRW